MINCLYSREKERESISIIHQIGLLTKEESTNIMEHMHSGREPGNYTWVFSSFDLRCPIISGVKDARITLEWVSGMFSNINPMAFSMFILPLLGLPPPIFPYLFPLSPLYPLFSPPFSLSLQILCFNSSLQIFCFQDFYVETENYISNCKTFGTPCSL